MSTITKSLEQTIEDLRTSIAEKNAELAIYQKVLQIEQSKGHSPAGPLPATSTPKESAKGQKTSAAKRALAGLAAQRGPARSSTDNGVTFTGNKTAFISAVLASRGSRGATPKEIGEVFDARKISRSDNLIYNTLSALVKQKKLDRNDGRCYMVESKRVAKKT